jgi:hypothetical protein
MAKPNSEFDVLLNENNRHLALDRGVRGFQPSIFFIRAESSEASLVTIPSRMWFRSLKTALIRRKVISPLIPHYMNF